MKIPQTGPQPGRSMIVASKSCILPQAEAPVPERGEAQALSEFTWQPPGKPLSTDCIQEGQLASLVVLRAIFYCACACASLALALSLSLSLSLSPSLSLSLSFCVGRVEGLSRSRPHPQHRRFTSRLLLRTGSSKGANHGARLKAPSGGQEQCLCA